MPISGNRLRWPLRPGKRLGDAAPSGTRRSSSNGGQPADAIQPLHQPDERDESADQEPTHPRESMQQAQNDVASGLQETDAALTRPVARSQRPIEH